MKTILFLCTGNYYRSRFSEYLFNDLALKRSLNWEADSRGLALERGTSNVGAISHYAKTGLLERGIPLPDDLRYPLPLTEQDLTAAARVIAVDESEHRPLFAEKFPRWEKAVEYWLVHDIDRATIEIALPQLERHINRLIESLD
jgi:protein-tyrosine phosphatase